MAISKKLPADNTKSKSQLETIRAHLMAGATLTTWDAYQLYQITCLSQRISDLRKAGLNIKSKIVTHNDKRFSVYWLDKQTLLENKLSNSEENIMPNSITATSNSQFIDHPQAGIRSFSLFNLDNLPVPLQLLAKARYFLSVILDEIAHTTRDSIFNRRKFALFTAKLHAELEQMPLAFVSYDDDLKALTEPLPHMAKQLYDSLYATDSVTRHEFEDIQTQVWDIYKGLERAIRTALYHQAEGK